jgi:hypothetical protein
MKTRTKWRFHHKSVKLHGRYYFVYYMYQVNPEAWVRFPALPEKKK